MKALAGLLVAIGITLLSLATSSISTPVTNTYSFGNHLSLSLPNLVQASYARLSVNSSNVTAYVKIVYPSGLVQEVKTPYSFPLYPGNWEFQLVSESYVKEVTKVLNVTEETKCGNVTTQKVITIPELVNSSTPVTNVSLTVTVYRMGVIGYNAEVEFLGVFLTVLGSLLYLIRLVRRQT